MSSRYRVTFGNTARQFMGFIDLDAPTPEAAMELAAQTIPPDRVPIRAWPIASANEREAKIDSANR